MKEYASGNVVTTSINIMLGSANQERLNFRACLSPIIFPLLGIDVTTPVVSSNPISWLEQLAYEREVHGCPSLPFDSNKELYVGQASGSHAFFFAPVGQDFFVYNYSSMILVSPLKNNTEAPKEKVFCHDSPLGDFFLFVIASRPEYIFNCLSRSVHGFFSREFS